MEGLRIRTEGGNAAQLAMMEALGAEAVPLPWGDVTTALASGVADGQFNAPYVNAFAKFWEVNDYSSWIKFMFNTAVWSVSDEWFQTLPEKEQNIILTTAEESIDIARGINAQQSLLDWETAKDKFEDTYNPPPEVMNEWKETLRPAFYEWVTEDFGIPAEEVDEFWNKAEEISNEVDNKIISNYGVK
jgi:TRAP-type C4-dicarboxylate transport system substrate-binding protein